jgi:hypothetical protein
MHHWPQRAEGFEAPAYGVDALEDSHLRAMFRRSPLPCDNF